MKTPIHSLLMLTLLAQPGAAQQSLAQPGAAAKGAPAAPEDSTVMLKVNGVPIRRSEVADRAWKEYASAVLNAMVDDILVRQAQEKQGVKAKPREVDARLKRVRGQFADEKTFQEKLKAGGSSLPGLRAQIETQVAREELVVKAKDLSVTDREAREFFDANKDKLGAPEAARLRHILLAGRKQAEDFLIALKAGADFPKLAAQASLDSSTRDRGGDLGFISRGMLQPEIEKAVFALKPGEVSEVVKTAQGYSLFKVEERRASKPAVFAEIKDDLKQSILADKISRAWPGYLQDLRSQAQFEGLRRQQ